MKLLLLNHHFLCVVLEPITSVGFHVFSVLVFSRGNFNEIPPAPLVDRCRCARDPRDHFGLLCFVS